MLAALTQLASGQPLPPPDRYEPNDDAGVWSQRFGPPRTITATLDYWDDQIDVYSLTVRKGTRVFARLSPPARTATKLVLWKPQTQRVEGLRVPLSNRAAQSARVGAQERLAYTIPAGGTYYLETKLVAPTQDPVEYRLSLSTRRAAAGT